MKRVELLKQLKQIAKSKGERLQLDEGSRHTHAKIGDFRTEVPRHSEINERLAQDILKKARKS